MVPEESTENILALMSTPLKTEYPAPALEQKELALIRQLAGRTNLAYVRVQKGNTSITVQRNS
jgi:hypothetical protein